MSVADNIDKRATTPDDTSRHDATSLDTSRYVGQLEKRIEEKDQTIKFLQEELTDRRAQISGMKEIIDGQRGLLKQINERIRPGLWGAGPTRRAKEEGRVGADYGNLRRPNTGRDR